MSFIRLLLIAGIIWLLFHLIKKLVSKGDADPGKSLEITPMVRCGYCDVYLVRQDAYFKDNNYYCSPDHYEKKQQEKT